MTHPRIATVTTDVLEIAYEERGDADAPAVLLVHGWPDDVRTWDAVAAELVARGYRTLAPYLRGFGPTRFRSASTMRSGEIAAVARDAIAFADALGLERPVFAGQDWGGRAAYAAAVLEPDRFAALVSIANPYGTNLPSQHLSFDELRAYWYQWFLGTPRGAAAFTADPASFARELWRTWSPDWQFDDATFAATARSFENPDFAAVTIHSYRVRWGGAEGDPRYREDAERIASLPHIAVPTTTILGARDGVTMRSSAEGRDRFFDDEYDVLVVSDAGHFVQRERPDLVADAIAYRARPPAR